MTALRSVLVFVAAACSFGLGVANAQTCPLSPQKLLPSICYEEVSLCTVSQAQGNAAEVTRTFTRAGGSVRVMESAGEATPKLVATCFFDANDRLVRFDAVDAVKQVFGYDEEGRLSRVDFSQHEADTVDESCIYAYDEREGQLAWHDHLGDGVATHRVFYHFDGAGKLEATTRDHRVDGSINGPRYTFVYENDRLVREGTDRYVTKYRYDLAGNQTVVEHLVAGKVTGHELSTYDAEGRLSSVRVSKNGRLQQLENRIYDLEGRLESVVLTSGNGAVIGRTERAYGCGPGEQLSGIDMELAPHTM